MTNLLTSGNLQTEEKLRNLVLTAVDSCQDFEAMKATIDKASLRYNFLVPPEQLAILLRYLEEVGLINSTTQNWKTSYKITEAGKQRLAGLEPLKPVKESR